MDDGMYRAWLNFAKARNLTPSMIDDGSKGWAQVAAATQYRNTDHARDGFRGFLKSQGWNAQDLAAATDWAEHVERHGYYNDTGELAPPEQATSQQATSQQATPTHAAAPDALAAVQSQMKAAMADGSYFKPSVEAQFTQAIAEATGESAEDREALANEVGAVVEARPGSINAFHSQSIRELMREPGGYQKYWKAVQNDPVVDATSRAAFAGEAAESAVAEQSAPAPTSDNSE